METPRKPTVPTTDAIDCFCAQFADLFTRRAARQAFRHYLIGLLLPLERNKTMRSSPRRCLAVIADRSSASSMMHRLM
jgi:hypothetical protein